MIAEFTAQDITTIIVSLTVFVPATIAAVAAVRSRRDLRTRNGRTTGQTIDDVAQTIEIVQAQAHTNVKEIVGLGQKIDRVADTVDRIDGRVDRVDSRLEKHLNEEES